MIGGGARISRDVPAFTMVTERDALIGLNAIGIRRRGFSRNAVQELKEAFRAVYSSGNIREHARDALESGRFQEPSTRRFLTYFFDGTRGFVRPRRQRSSEEESS
jgi:UDP-N-acetylglucosamine acyltransferase